MSSDASDVVSLPLGCPHCGGHVTIDHSADGRLEPRDQVWECPYCRRPNVIRIGGQIGPAVAVYGTKVERRH